MNPKIPFPFFRHGGHAAISDRLACPILTIHKPISIVVDTIIADLVT